MISDFFWEDQNNFLMVPKFIFEQKELENKVAYHPCTDKKFIYYLLLGVATAEEYREQRHPFHNWSWLKNFCLFKVK